VSIQDAFLKKFNESVTSSQQPLTSEQPAEVSGATDNTTADNQQPVQSSSTQTTEQQEVSSGSVDSQNDAPPRVGDSPKPREGGASALRKVLAREVEQRKMYERQLAELRKEFEQAKSQPQHSRREEEPVRSEDNWFDRLLNEDGDSDKKSEVKTMREEFRKELDELKTWRQREVEKQEDMALDATLNDLKDVCHGMPEPMMLRLLAAGYSPAEIAQDWASIAPPTSARSATQETPRKPPPPRVAGPSSVGKAAPPRPDFKSWLKTGLPQALGDR